MQKDNWKISNVIIMPVILFKIFESINLILKIAENNIMLVNKARTVHKSSQIEFFYLYRPIYFINLLRGSYKYNMYIYFQVKMYLKQNNYTINNIITL